MVTRTPKALARVADDLLEHADVLVEEQLTALEPFAGYQRVPRPALRRSSHRNVLRVVAVLQGRDELPPEAEEDEQSSGRQRALQGIPAEEVTDAYRAVMRVLREAFLDSSRRLGVPTAAVLTGTRLLWDLIDRFSAELVVASRAIDAELVRRDEQTRLAFLQRLLSGTLLPTEVLAGGGAYGLTQETEYWISRGRHPDEHRHNLARVLESSGGDAHFRPLIGWIDGDVVAITVRRPQVDADGSVLAVAGPVGPAGFPQAFGEATRLLNVALRYQRCGLVERDTLSVRIAVVEENELSDALVDRHVTPVLAAGSMAASLLETVRAYLAARRHVENTALALSVHPNTVRYRLARFTELTKADLADTETLIEVWWALESWALHRCDPPR
jgi:putative transposase